MKTLQLIAIAIISTFFIASCEKSTSPTEDPNVNIIGELATPSVTMSKIGKTSDQIQSNEVDSIKIIRVRILMSQMKLFPDNSTAGAVIKTEPFVYDLSTTGGETVLGNSNVPAGIYKNIKIEIHRFSTSELIQHSNNSILRDFATPERYTMLIEGITYKNEDPSTFTYKSNAVANLTLNFEQLLNLKNNSKSTIAIKIDPNFFFKKWQSVLDPNDPKNTNDIENAIINTIKAMKK